MKETQKSTAVRYEGLIVRVRVDEVALLDGSLSRREVVEHPGGVAVLGLTADGNVPVVRQYRYPVQDIVTEIPAGKLERDENPLDAAVREFAEETGYTAQRWDSLGVYYASPGVYGERIHLYLARELAEGNPTPDEGEFLEQGELSFAALLEMAHRGELVDGKTLAALLKAQLFLEKERK